MELTNRFFEEKPGSVVVSVTDERLAHPKTLVLKSHIIHLFNDGCSQIVLNLEHLETIDSFGLAVLLSILKMSRDHHGTLVICNVKSDVMRLIELTRLDRILPIFPGEAEALASL